jgi:hypothetical protein
MFISRVWTITVGQLNPSALRAFAGKVSGSVTGGLNCALTLVGDQLGLYQAHAKTGPYTTQALSDATSLSECWVVSGYTNNPV